MTSLSRSSLLKSLSLFAAAIAPLPGGAASAATLTWSTAVNNPVTAPASSATNQLRAVAVAHDNASVYAGYIQTSGNRRVHRHDSVSPFAVLNAHASGLDQPKGIAVDDRGNVFIANRGSGTTSSRIQSFSSTLAPNSTTTATTPVIGGLAIHEVAGTYYAYAVYETGGLIQRYNVTNPAAMTLDASFGTGGSYNLPGGNNLRGIDVGADGSLYVAARTEGQVWRVSGDLATVTSFPLNRAMDVALYGGNIYATSYDGLNSFIRVIDATTMAFLEDITIATLDGNPYSRGANEGWSGIDIDAGGNIWLADQHYGSAGGTQDRLLRGSTLAIPEPASAALAAGASIGALIARGRRRGA